MSEVYEVTSLNADLITKKGAVHFRKKGKSAIGKTIAVHNIDLTVLGDLRTSKMDDAVVALAVKELVEAASVRYVLPAASE